MRHYTEINLTEITNNREDSSSCSNEKQLATAYIVYMMVGSYYEKCFAVNEIKENNMFLHYKDMRGMSQERLEKRIEKEFMKECDEYLDEFAKMHCLMYFYQNENLFRLVFYTGIENITVLIDQEANVKFVLAEAE